MIHAYDNMYLENAQNNLAVMFDYVINDMKISIQEFEDLFPYSDVAHKFQHGDVSVVAGKSGVELAYEILSETKGLQTFVEPSFSMEKSKEYWAGWALAYYQWYKAKSFQNILEYISISNILELYEPYHEMDIRQLVERLDSYNEGLGRDSNLKKYRLRAGLTQKDLAKLSEIPLRSLQQYEQKQKNINKAQAEYVLRLAQVLCCNPVELLE